MTYQWSDRLKWADCGEPYQRDLDGMATMWITEQISTEHLAAQLWDVWAQKRDFEPREAATVIDKVDAQIAILVDAMRMAPESKTAVSTPDERQDFLEASLANRGNPAPSWVRPMRRDDLAEDSWRTVVTANPWIEGVTWADCRQPYRRELDDLATMWVNDRISTRQMALKLWNLWARKRDSESKEAAPAVILRRNDRVDAQIEILVEAMRMALSREEDVEFSLPDERWEFLQKSLARFGSGGKDLQR